MTHKQTEMYGVTDRTIESASGQKFEIENITRSGIRTYTDMTPTFLGTSLRRRLRHVNKLA